MSSKYKFVNDGHIYFVSFAVVYWIDLFDSRCKLMLAPVGGAHVYPDFIGKAVEVVVLTAAEVRDF